MPFYSTLKVRTSDSPNLKAKKRRIASRVQLLKKELKKHFEESSTKTENHQSIKIATWNLRDFGAGKYKGRGIEELTYITEIISHFDLIALQEVRADLTSLNKVMWRLGNEDWDYIATDVTDGHAGNGERMVFVFNKKKINFKNIAGEITLKKGSKVRAAFGERIKLKDELQLVLPDNTNLSGEYPARIKTRNGKKFLDSDIEIELPEGATLKLPKGLKLTITKNTEVESQQRGKAIVDIPVVMEGENYRLKFSNNTFDDSYKQFARTPFLISFQSGWLKLNLCTVHIYYGHSTDKSKLKQREDEIRYIAESLSSKAKTEYQYDYESFLGVLGDFNIIGKGHPTMEALESNGFVIPEELKSIPGSNVAKDKAYDQIAFWKPTQNTQYSRLDILGANVFDFYEHVFTKNDEQVYRQENALGLKPSSKFSTWRTYKMSDHLPMWIELRTDFGKEYLDKVIEDEDW